MVIIKVMGGFGNQLFQYAFGKEIEYRFGYEVKYDLSYYDAIPSEDTKRDLYLKQLILHEKTVDKAEIAFFLKMWKLKKIFKRTNKVKVFDDDVDINTFSGLEDNVYCIGYWQSEKYFKDVVYEIANDINKCFDVRSPKAKDLLNEVNKNNSIAIHVRGGDYLNSNNIGTFGNICNSNYYKKAFEYIKKNVDDCKFYLFTNDIEWTKNNIDLPYEDITVVSEMLGEEDTIDEFVLMSNCKHNIIANSTYSWWSAWLNDNPRKIVVGPCKWTNDGKCLELLKKEWIRL